MNDDRYWSSLTPRQQALQLARRYAYINDLTAIRAHVIRETGVELPLDVIAARQAERRAVKRADRRTFKSVARERQHDEYEGNVWIDRAEAADAQMVQRLAAYQARAA